MFYNFFGVDLETLRAFWEAKLGVALTQDAVACWVEDTIEDALHKA